METSIRRRNVSPEADDIPTDTPVKEIVKQLDAFPKFPRECTETSVKGAGISIVTFLLIFFLICSEIYSYWDTDMRYTYEVDKDHDSKLRLNIDITVAMRCANLGPDVLDATGQDLSMGHQGLNQDDVMWELDSVAKSAFEALQMINVYLRSEQHSLQDLVWKRHSYHYWDTVFRRGNEKPAEGTENACRIHGSLLLNKVAGNLHIVAGKSISLGERGHAHLAMMMDSRDYNFSHRINHLSFGDPVAGRFNPLDAEERVVHHPHHLFQYFIQVVPTFVNTRQATADTYQFAVTDQNRTIDHTRGSHGSPGIFFKYDVTSLKVSVVEEFQPFLTFLVRLAGLVGGLFATSGLINFVVDAVVSCVCCRGMKAPLDSTTISPNKGNAVGDLKTEITPSVS